VGAALVIETGKPIAQVARDLGINEGTLGNWCAQERRTRKKDRCLDPDERAELERLRPEVIELRMQRDVLIGHVERRARAGRSGRLVMS
jgi:transposase